MENRSEYVFFASHYAKLDSSVLTGGGTDDTAAIQALLDKAVELGQVYLIMDGAALVTGLRIYSNTTIECLNTSCGFFLADQSNGSILRNAHFNFIDEQRERNITLIGGTYNHNCAGQEHHIPLNEENRTEYTSMHGNLNVFENGKWVIAFEFFGVEYLTVRDIVIRDQRTFAMLLANWKHVTMENISIELPGHMDYQNQDGIHFWGPGQFLSMKNIKGAAGDDFIALAPDEHDGVSDITDVIIDGVFLDNADQGIRMLSRGTGRLDRVIVKNVTGTYKSFGFIINPWFTGNGGNYGNIVFDNIDLRQTAPNYTYFPNFLFKLGGNIESITFKNIYHHNPQDARSILEIGGAYASAKGGSPDEPSEIGSIVVDGLHVVEKGSAAAQAEYIQVKCKVDSLVIRNSEIIRDSCVPIAGSLVKVMNDDAKLGRLWINGLSVNWMESLVHVEYGQIDTVRICNILHDDMGKDMVKIDKGVVLTEHIQP